MYKLTVQKTIPNPNFSQKTLDEYHESHRYGDQDFRPATMSKEIDTTILVVELGEEEFNAMKKSIIETLE